MRGRRGQRAFTLIELLIVVGIMALLTAGVVPLVLGKMRGAPRQQARELSQSSLSAQGVGSGSAPVETSEVQVQLLAAPVLDGLQVHTRYQATFRGTFAVRNEGPSGPLSLDFPFPPGMTEARDAQLTVRDDEGRPLRGATRYRQEGMGWEGPVASGQRLLAEVTYQAEGRDAFVYAVAGPGRSGAIRFELSVPPGTHLGLDPSSLSPTAAGPDHMEFHYDRLITKKPIAVRLPPGPSPLGRVILLCQLAGLSVLLFGAGFWYLSEQRSPGALDDFRLGHFLLLALNHGLFFALFAVLGYDGQVAVPLALAAAPSLTLLTVHVARTFDWVFALTRALPLAALTLGAAVAGVYLEEQRPLLLVALLALIVGYVTLTYRDWSERRLVHERQAARRHEREARLDALQQRWLKVQAAVDETRAAARAATEAELLASAGGEAEARRLGERRSQAEAEAARAAALEEALRSLALLSDERDEARELELALKLAVPRLERERAALVEASDALRAAAEREALRTRRAGAASPHCTACGVQLAEGAQFCQGCGALAPRPLPCQTCGHEALLPGQWRRSTLGPLHCHGCGAPLEPPPAAPPRDDHPEAPRARARARR